MLSVTKRIFQKKIVAEEQFAKSRMAVARWEFRKKPTVAGRNFTKEVTIKRRKTINF